MESPGAVKGKALHGAFSLISMTAPALASRISNKVMKEHNARQGKRDMFALTEAYGTLYRKPEFQTLRSTVGEVVASGTAGCVWDSWLPVGQSVACGLEGCLWHSRMPVTWKDACGTVGCL